MIGTSLVNSNVRDTFALKFSIDWNYVDVIRTFVNNFLQRSLIDNKKSDKVAMAVSELLENAVKYGKHEGANRLSNIHIQLDALKEEGKVIFFIENTSETANINTLKEQLEEVNKGDPKEMYVKKIKESLLSDEKSQLGLARIRYEAGGQIELEVKDDERVRVKVIFNT